MRFAPQETQASPTFLIAAAAVAAVVIGLLLWVAAHEWFFGDDFLFLAQAQRPRSLSDWWHVFAPFRPRLWWSYRPLTIEVYFSLCTRLFGLQPFGFLAVNIAVHAAAALMVMRIAKQLGIGVRAAVFAGVLALSMYPSSREIFWASTFQHVAVRFLLLVCVSSFVEYLRLGDWRWQAASLAALLLALLGNELAVTFPAPLLLFAVALGSGPLRPRIYGAMRSAAPQILLVAVYAVFRWFLFAKPTMAPSFMYISRFGPHMAVNLVAYMGLLVHQSASHAAVALAVILAAWGALWGRGNREVAAALAGHCLLYLAWMLSAVLPFVGMFHPHQRVGMILEIPACLLLAAHVDALQRLLVPRRLPILEWAVIGVLVAAVPFATLRERARSPSGQINRAFADGLKSRPPLGKFGCVVLRLAGDQEWRWGDRFAVNFRMNGILNALHPGLTQQLFIDREPLQRKECLEMILRRAPDGSYGFEVRDLIPVGPAATENT